MKETNNWLKIAERKTQIELTFLRRQIKSVATLEERRDISSEIKLVRRAWRQERLNAVSRGDLSAEKYRPSPPKPEPTIIITLDPEKTETQQRELLMVS